MKIRAPDDVEINKADQFIPKSQIKKEKPTLQQEITDIIKLPMPLSSFILVDKSLATDTPEFRHQMLLKFTQFCRDEVFPRQVKAIETIQSRSDQLQCQLVCQHKDVARLISLRAELQQGLDNLEVKRIQAQTKHQEMTDRLKETLGKLQDCCKNKTAGEKKTMQELISLHKKAENMRIHITETKSKVNYYSTQVQVQGDSVRKYTKPLYLDKNRTVFLRSSLNSMRQNIEDLVHRVNTLNNQGKELTDINESVLHNLSCVSNLA